MHPYYLPTQSGPARPYLELGKWERCDTNSLIYVATVLTNAPNRPLCRFPDSQFSTALVSKSQPLHG